MCYFENVSYFICSFMYVWNHHHTPTFTSVHPQHFLSVCQILRPVFRISIISIKPFFFPRLFRSLSNYCSTMIQLKVKLEIGGRSKAQITNGRKPDEKLNIATILLYNKYITTAYFADRFPLQRIDCYIIR